MTVQRYTVEWFEPDVSSDGYWQVDPEPVNREMTVVLAAEYDKMRELLLKIYVPPEDMNTGKGLPLWLVHKMIRETLMLEKSPDGLGAEPAAGAL